MNPRPIVNGAIAGTISAFAFTVLHQLLISSIWFMLVPMLVAGAMCGACIGWSYALLAKRPGLGSWWQYNSLYVLLLLMLGPVSLLVFEPVITFPALLASPSGLPADLVRAVMPLAAIYTVVMALIITLFYGRRWSRLPVVLSACGILMLLLGLNIAAFGLVFLPAGWLPVFLEMLLLVLALNLVYGLAFVALGYGWLWPRQRQDVST